LDLPPVNESKQCLGGDYVDRTGPNCEFSECPQPFCQISYEERNGEIIFNHSGWKNNGERTLENVDVLTFERVGCVYSKDKNKVFAYGREIINADPSTFSDVLYIPTFSSAVENYVYGKDKNFVYYGSSVLEGADSSTFNIKEVEYAPREAWTFNRGDFVRIDLEVLGYDKNNVYINDQKLENIDINDVSAERYAPLSGYPGTVIKDSDTKWFLKITDCYGGSTYIPESELEEYIDYLIEVRPC